MNKLTPSNQTEKTSPGTALETVNCSLPGIFSGYGFFIVGVPFIAWSAGLVHYFL